MTSPAGSGAGPGSASIPTAAGASDSWTGAAPRAASADIPTSRGGAAGAGATDAGDAAGSAGQWTASVTWTYAEQRLRMLGWAIAATGLAAACLVLFVLTAVGIPLVIVSVGIPLLYGLTYIVRPMAGLHRRIAGIILDREIGSPYLRRTTGNLLTRLRDLVADRATWRDAAWIAANGTVGLALSIAGIVEAVLDLLFWWLPPGQMMRIHAHLAAALLAPTDATTLAQRVQRLAETRADAADMSAAELRRIERDLHDGAQARLVALGMSLGLAEETIVRDPAAARALIAEARESGTAALNDLRDLVRGIHPPVLADRGLVGAVSALALSCPIPVEVRGDLAARLPAPVESAAYFVIAEAVGNLIKHSGATAAAITIERRSGGVRLEVTDDGRGGADERLGTGLTGIRRRLAAFDGTLQISSPAGGPTTLTMTIPV